MHVLTRDGARAYDVAAQERFAIPGIVLMENAAIGMAAIACEMLGTSDGARVAVVCGPGNNGGDGYAIARHLANAGAAPALVPIGLPREGGDAATNRRICVRMGIPEAAIASLAPAPRLVIDALFGSGLDRPIEGESLEAVRAMNRCGAPILAVDIPSGLDADRGVALGDAVRARVTAVTVAPRPAMVRGAGREWCGEVRVVDIGAPRELLSEFAVESE